MAIQDNARDNKPLSLSQGVSWTEAELHEVFELAADPDEQLYFDIYSDKWTSFTEVEQLERLLQVAQLVEAAAKAHSSNPSLVIEPKGAMP